MKPRSMILRVNLPRLTSGLLLAVLIMALVFAGSRPVFAAPKVTPTVTPTVTLGSAASFAVLGGSTVTNTGLTIITGDLGVSPGTAITGFPPGIVIGGTVHAGDEIAAQAQTDLTTAYNNLAGMPCDFNLSGQDLGGMTLSPGVYCFDSSAQLTGTLHLNGPATAVYIFQIGSTLTTASNSFVIVDNNSCGGNVFWQIGSSATLGPGTTFAGNIVALTSITLTGGATISGRALASNGAVTMDTNSVSACIVGGTWSGKLKVTGGGQIPVPQPTSAGRASFGFNAQLNSDGTAKGDFNYVNHFTGLHVNGPVDSIVVIATNLDGSPKTVQFSGTCRGDLPACKFTVTVEDHGEPGTGDQFGIIVTGGLSEVTSLRTISAGNIQFHPTKP